MRPFSLPAVTPVGLSGARHATPTQKAGRGLNPEAPYHALFRLLADEARLGWSFGPGRGLATIGTWGNLGIAVPWPKRTSVLQNEARAASGSTTG
jgi:hypothetical protein